MHRRLPSLFVAAATASVAAAVSASSATAQTSWTAGTGDWFDAANWSAGVPDAAATANIANGGTAQIAAGPAAAATLNLGGVGGAGAVTLGGATTTLATTGAYVGRSGAAAFTLNDGRHSVSDLFVGYDAGAVGHYQLNTGRVGVLNALGTRTIGYAGAGTVTQDGGSFNGTTTKLGELAGASGTYNLNAGTFTASQLTVGNAGSGTFRQSGGTATVSAHVVVAATTPGATGLYQLSSGSLETPGLQAATAGTFVQSGGTLVDRFAAPVGTLSVSPGGEYRITGGTATVHTTTMSGGTLRLAGGAFTTRDLRPPSITAAPSAVVVSGGTHTVQATMEIGANSALDYSGGSLTVFTLTSNGIGAQLNFDLDPAAPFQPIHITGSLGGPRFTLDVDLADNNWQLIDGDDTFTLTSAGPFAGSNPQFQVPNGGRLDVGVGSFQLNYGSSSAFDTGDVVLSHFQPVPEPTGIAAMIALAAPFALRRRRRNAE